MKIFSKIKEYKMFLIKKIIILIIFLLSFNVVYSESVQETYNSSNVSKSQNLNDENPKILSFNNIFLDGAVQRYIAVQELQDYTMPKPGWIASLGYDFFLSYSHSIQFMISSGHNVISGTNPLVRMLDIYPLSMGLGYSFSPNHRNWQWLSIGLSGGGGIYFSEISHYETVLNLVNQNLTTTNGLSSMFYGRLNFGVNFFDNKLKLCINAGIDCIKEIDGIISIPVVEVGFRIYPVAAIKSSRSYNEIHTEIVKAYDKGELINIYFNANSDKLSKESIQALIEVGKYLKFDSEQEILIQGHSAPFETEKLQYQMGLNRANIVKNFLVENFNIESNRIKSESLGASQAGTIVSGKTNEDYKKYRMVQLKKIMKE